MLYLSMSWSGLMRPYFVLRMNHGQPDCSAYERQARNTGFGVGILGDDSTEIGLRIPDLFLNARNDDGVHVMSRAVIPPE